MTVRRLCTQQRDYVDNNIEITFLILISMLSVLMVTKYVAIIVTQHVKAKR